MRRQPSARASSGRRTRAPLCKLTGPDQKSLRPRKWLVTEASRELEKQDVEWPQHEEASMQAPSPPVVTTQHPGAELDRVGDEIAELSAHLDAATARLLELIRQFDARGGWNTGFASCAAWLSWRVGLDLGAARERVRG